MTRLLRCKGRTRKPSSFIILRTMCFGLFGVSLVVLVLSSCTSAKINHFKEFAKAGVRYADAVSPIFDTAGEAAIDADSLILTKTRSLRVSAREGMTGDELKAQATKDSKLLLQDLNQHNELLRARLDVLSDLQRHLSLLKNYFIALGALAASDTPSAIGESAKGTVDALESISGRVKKAKIGDIPVADFVQPITTIVVSQFQRAALENELNARAVVVANEIDLQKAALAAIGRSMLANLTLIMEEEERAAVSIPYSSSEKPLPPDWAAKRRESLNKTVKIEPIETAKNTAERLRISFIALVENRFGLEDVGALVQDIDRLATIVEEIRKPQKQEN